MKMIPDRFESDRMGLYKSDSMEKTILLTIIMILAGCAGLVPHQPEPSVAPGPEDQTAIRNNALIRKKLMDQYTEWKGTRYRAGGLSRNGVDCSGFVYLTFRSKLNIHLPRSADLQSRCGVPVSKNNLNPGDLVFFRTGFFGQHVGVYIGEDRFLHASSTNGVTISKLSNEYWASAYCFSRRVTIRQDQSGL
ncbi:MAG: NlpC/P60 family protein [Pseudomonadota bacterium]